MLREAYAAGRLSREEFDERIVAALSASTWGELRDITADLDSPPPHASLPAADAAPLRASLLVLAADLAAELSPRRYGWRPSWFRWRYCCRCRRGAPVGRRGTTDFRR
jgi:Domain of unknown function (DUF1707)